jgi:hypothetical protein
MSAQLQPPSVHPGFRRMGRYHKDASPDENTRAFLGDGTPFLRVPGLRRVTRVVCEGGIEIPLEHSEQVVADAGGRLEMDAFPMLALDEAPDGCPILLRHEKSNDGLWQDRFAFFVSGEWDEAVVAEAVPHVTRDEKIIAAASKKSH